MKTHQRHPVDGVDVQRQPDWTRRGEDAAFRHRPLYFLQQEMSINIQDQNIESTTNLGIVVVGHSNIDSRDSFWNVKLGLVKDQKGRFGGFIAALEVFAGDHWVDNKLPDAGVDRCRQQRLEVIFKGWAETSCKEDKTDRHS